MDFGVKITIFDGFLGNFAYMQNLTVLLVIMVGRLCDREELGISLVY